MADDNSSKKVLIVEDDAAISQMYLLKLQNEKYNVQVAENGKLGLAAAEAMHPDIILLDLMMPQMTGDEMLAALRKTDWGKKIRVLILTNMGEAEVAEHVLDLGVDGFIVKAQYTPAQVVEKLESILAA